MKVVAVMPTSTAFPARALRRMRAFTLLEVLVALAIVAVGMVAVFTQAGQATHATALMRDKTMASWIAMNRMTEIALETGFPDPGEGGGELEFGDRRWLWREEISDTPSPAIRRVDIRVSLEQRPDRTIHTLSGFLGRRPPPAAVSPWAPDMLAVPPDGLVDPADEAVE